MKKFKGLMTSWRDDWRTPISLFNELNKEFNFDFDPCPNNPTFDGLAISWGKSTFCNPPYGRTIGLWLKKGYEEWQKGKLVVFLIPSRTDTIWFHDFVMKATEIRFIEGRLKFSEYHNIIRYALHITSRCNMGCKYCREVKGHAIMSRLKFIDLCKRAGNQGIIHITGGEPLLVPWLEEEIYNYRDVTRFALNSNLLIMPQDETLQSIFRCKTSLDDYDEDRWNKVVGGDFFKTVVLHIKQVTEKVEYTSVCFTATHQNANRLKDFISFCNVEFPSLFSISVSFLKGNNQELVLTQKDIDLLFDASKKMNDVSRQLFIETHSRQGNYFPTNIEIPCYLSLTERLYDEYNQEYYCSHLYRDKVTAPGNPGNDKCCITGCNLRFNKYNQYVHYHVMKNKI